MTPRPAPTPSGRSLLRRVVAWALLVLLVVGLLSAAWVVWEVGFRCRDDVRVFGLAGYSYLLSVPHHHFERVGRHGLIYEACGWRLVVNEQEEITLDGQRFGTMQPGDRLRVTSAGEVFLNREALSPLP